ncbi:MAG: hypothetical protein ACOZB0_01510 [Pseudomonadota bacterium]
MQTPSPRTQFMIGNILLGLALLTLFFLGPLSEWLGVGAMVLWMSLAGLGIYFIMQDKSTPADHPD